MIKKGYYCRKIMLLLLLGFTLILESTSVSADEITDMKSSLLEDDMLENIESEAMLASDNVMKEESGIIDTTPPTLLSLKFVKNEQGYLEFVATGTDDISGLMSVSYGLVSESNDFYVNTRIQSYSVSNKDGITTVKGNLSFSESILASLPDTFYVRNITVSDYAGNTVTYDNNNFPEGVQSSITIYSQDEINMYGNTSVSGAEFIESMSIDKSEVYPGNTITIKVVGSKNMQDRPSKLDIQFDYTMNSYFCPMVATLEDEDGDGEYVGQLVIPEYQPGRQYRAWLMSYNNNLYQFTGDKAQKIIPIFTVINDNIDAKAPTLKSINVKKSSVSVPGTIEVIADLDDDTGVFSVQVEVTMPNGKKRTISLFDKYADGNQSVKYGDGLWHGYIDINQYYRTGIGYIDNVTARDYAGNSATFLLDEKVYYKIINDADNTVKITSSSQATLIDDIKNTPDDATVSVDITGNMILSKEVLEIISGTNKTLLLNCDDIQWVVKGCDLTDNLRAIDLDGEYAYIENSYYYQNEYKQVKQIVGDKVTFGLLKLNEEGALPGTILLRPVLHMEMLGGSNSSLNVYRFDESIQKIELIKENVPVINGNNLEFSIIKGGIYIFTPDKINTSDDSGISGKPGVADNPSTSDKTIEPTTPTQPSTLDETIPTGPNTWENKSGSEGFVYRLYNVALTRDAEAAGLTDWNNKLTSKKQTAAEVAQGIFFSAEFQNKNYSDVQYVKFLYRTMFGREADEAGLRGWIEKLDSGMSREFVFRGFAESQEFGNLCNSYNINRGTVTLGQYRDKNEGATGYVSRLYTKMLGRKYEDAGIEYWCREYLTGKVTIENIATNGFLHSQEFKNLNLSNEEFVTRMYRTFLNREPDEAGYKDWVGKLNSGAKTRDDLVYGFSLSQEFSNLKKSYGL